jgi:hypothetical protein
VVRSIERTGFACILAARKFICFSFLSLILVSRRNSAKATSYIETLDILCFGLGDEGRGAMVLADATVADKWVVVTSVNGPTPSMQHLSNLSGWQVGFLAMPCHIARYSHL